MICFDWFCFDIGQSWNNIMDKEENFQNIEHWRIDQKQNKTKQMAEIKFQREDVMEKLKLVGFEIDHKRMAEIKQKIQINYWKNMKSGNRKNFENGNSWHKIINIVLLVMDLFGLTVGTIIYFGHIGKHKIGKSGGKGRGKS